MNWNSSAFWDAVRIVTGTIERNEHQGLKPVPELIGRQTSRHIAYLCQK